jgi:flagellar hook-associated protein 3 FlgL
MRYLQRNGSALNKQYEQISSNQKINRPSDNPIGFTNALNYGNILSALGQQKVNMEDGEIYMNMLETAHKSITNVFGRCRDLAVQSANDTEKHQDRLFTNGEIRELLYEMVTISQTKHKDGYIFSGKWINQPPYEIKLAPALYNQQDLNDGLSNFYNGEPITIQLFDGEYQDPNLYPNSTVFPPTERHPQVQRIIPGSISGLESLQEKSHLNDPENDEADYEIDYVSGKLILLSDAAKAAFYRENPPGTVNLIDPPPNMSFDYIYRNSIDMSGEIYREVSTGITMKVNTNPDDLFGKKGQNDTDSFKEIISLMQGLWYNDQPQINRGIDNLDKGEERNLAQQAIEGARQNRLSTIYDRNDYFTIDNTAAKGALQDIELEKAAPQFALAEAVYNASLQMAATIMQRTLMDYL